MHLSESVVRMRKFQGTCRGVNRTGDCYSEQITRTNSSLTSRERILNGQIMPRGSAFWLSKPERLRREQRQILLQFSRRKENFWRWGRMSANISSALSDSGVLPATFPVLCRHLASPILSSDIWLPAIFLLSRWEAPYVWGLHTTRLLFSICSWIFFSRFMLSSFNLSCSAWRMQTRLPFCHLRTSERCLGP